MYYEMGDFTRPITTHEATAQTWFDRGLIWVYGFNHEEAIRCFEKAITYDATCAMAWWGIAYAHGPYINKEWRFYEDAELSQTLAIVHDSLSEAHRHKSAGTPREQALIEALAVRYQASTPQPLSAMEQWLDDYAQAMRQVYHRFPDDLDVIALTAEAMMMRTPWRLWETQTGQPVAEANTMEMIEMLERGLAITAHAEQPPHPGIAHMMIHTMEMSPEPERAQHAADGLRDLVPDGGHLQHMPSHIDVLCGAYDQAIVASEKAIAADHKYLAQIGVFGQYTTACCHDNHLLMFAAMLSGRFSSAWQAAKAIETLITDEVLQSATPAFQITLEAYFSMSMHVLIRFGRWEQIVATPMPVNPDLYPVTTAMHHYAKAIALATLGRFEKAEQERHRFERILTAISTERHLFNNTSHTVLSVARAMMLGEIAYHQGDYNQAYSHLRQAVSQNDNLHYTEPWAWMHPPRHALGALLLAQGHTAEAETVYMADLGLAGDLPRSSQHPQNVWSLHGLVECWETMGKTKEADQLRPALDKALAFADVPISASCFCRTDCCHS